MIKPRKIITILGPTSSGKTSLALFLAKNTQGEIISCDSRQIYTDMTVGTGKFPVGGSRNIQRKEDHYLINDIRIWGYDLVFPDKYFSTHDFKGYFNNVVMNIPVSKNILCVGGTGFYIDVLFNNIKLDSLGPDFDLRERLSKLSLLELQEEYKKVKSDLDVQIDLNNKHRLIRQIEKLSSDVLPNQNRVHENIDYNVIYIGLKAARAVLYARVDTWIDTIWADLLLETKKLIEKYGESNSKLDGLIYGSVKKYLEGDLTQEEAKQRVKFDLHAYVRRQETYFKKMDRKLNINWFDVSGKDLYSKVLSFLT